MPRRKILSGTPHPSQKVQSQFENEKMQVIRLCTEAEFEPSATRKHRLYLVAQGHARNAYALREAHEGIDPNGYLFKALVYLPDKYRLKY